MSNVALSDRRSFFDPQTPWRFGLLLSAIVLAGVWLRCWQANESLWLDELHTSWVVANAPADIALRARAGNQSPLYFYIVWGVTQLCGHSQWALRITSLVSGSVLMVAVAYLVRRWTDSMASGLLAALLLALNRDCIFFAQEARPYALVQLSALLHAAVFVAMLKRPTWANRGFFVLGAVWLFYLHYTAFLFLMAEAICLVGLLLFGNMRIAYRRSQAICDALLIALLLLPASSHLLIIAQRRENWARIVQAWPLPYPLQVALVLFGLIPLAAVVAGYSLRWKRGALTLGSVVGIWAACWFVAPVMLAWIATWRHWAALCMVRYLVASVVGAIVFAAFCHGLFRSRWYQLALASVLVAGTVLTSGIIDQLRYDGRVIGDRREAWDEATQWLDQQLRYAPGPVFLCAGLLEDRELGPGDNPQLVEYCLFPLSGIHRLHGAHIEPLPTTATVALTPTQRELVEHERGMWLVVRGGSGTTERIATALCRDLARGGRIATVVKRRHFGMVAVLRIESKVQSLESRAAPKPRSVCEQAAPQSSQIFIIPPPSFCQSFCWR